MKLILGTEEVDLGRATSMRRISPKKVQSTELTANGEPYTQTWNYHTGAGWVFTFERVEESLLGELEFFYDTIAEASKNRIIVVLDNLDVHGKCIFSPGSEINVGEHETVSTNGVVLNAWQNVSFTIEKLP